MRRSILLALLASVLGVGAVLPLAQPASADPLLAWSVSHVEAHPGDTVTVTVTFTNPQAVPVTFSYMSVYPTYGTTNSDVLYEMTDCRGDVTWCWFPHPTARLAYAMHHQVAIPAGASRTVEVDFQVLPSSPCNGRFVHLYFYTYRESTAGFFGQSIAGPSVGVIC